MRISRLLLIAALAIVVLGLLVSTAGAGHSSGHEVPSLMSLLDSLGVFGF